MSPLRRRRRAAEPATQLSELIIEHRDTLDSGQLVRALARSIVHVPMPDEPHTEDRTERFSRGDGAPMYVIDDGDGRHALVYTTRERLVQAWGKDIRGATIDFTTLLMVWPEGVDLVIDAGHPEALEVPSELVRHTALEAAGIPTGTSLQPSPAGADARVPEPEPVQILGATRVVADRMPEVRALHRAEMVNREPDPRPVLHVVVGLDAVDNARLDGIMAEFTGAVSEVDPNPVAFLPVVEGKATELQHVVDAIAAVDSPYWERP